MKTIELTQGKFTIVDDDDYLWLGSFKWSVSADGYAIRNKKLGYGKNNRTIEYMHKTVMHCDGSIKQVDHINLDRLDNRKSNLRLCSMEQNRKNRKKTKNNTSGFKGVFWDKVSSKWYAQVTANRKVFSLGRSETKEEAARKYNQKATELHGEFAHLNQV